MESGRGAEEALARRFCLGARALVSLDVGRDWDWDCHAHARPTALPLSAPQGDCSLVGDDVVGPSPCAAAYTQFADGTYTSSHRDKHAQWQRRARFSSPRLAPNGHSESARLLRRRPDARVNNSTDSRGNEKRSIDRSLRAAGFMPTAHGHVLDAPHNGGGRGASPKGIMLDAHEARAAIFASEMPQR